MSMARHIAIYSLMIFSQSAIAQEPDVVGPSSRYPQERFRIEDAIPQRSESGQPYTSWTIFVICNPSWYGNSLAMNILKKRFIQFGEAIGPNDSAVWPVTASGDYNFGQAARLCRALNLSAKTSPHLVTTTVWPGQRGRKKYYRVSFGTSGPEVTEALLIDLTDRVINQQLSRETPGSDIWYAKAASAFTAFLAWAKPIAEGISMKIRTPIIEATYDPPYKRK